MPSVFASLIDTLADSKFDLRVEFRAVYSYYQTLKDKYSNTHGADPFGFFHLEDGIQKPKRQ